MSWFIFAVAAAILTAAAAIVEKKVLFKEHAMEFSAALALNNFVLAIPFLFFADYSSLSFISILLIFAASILGSIAYLLVAKSTRHMEVSVAGPLMIFSPAITALLAFFILGEALTRLQLGGILLMLIGSYVLEAKMKKLLEPVRIFVRSKYVHFIFAALVLYALSSVIDRTLLSRYQVDVITYLGIVHLFLAINFMVMIYLFHDGFNGITHGFKTAGWWIVLVAILTVGYRSTQIAALATAYTGLVIAIKRMSSIFTVIIGGELFHEEDLLKKTLATLVMIAGAVLIAW